MPRFQQFCHHQGYGECFAVSKIHVDQQKIYVDNRDPIEIFNSKAVPIRLLGKVGLEFEFRTKWGSGVLIQNPDEVSFAGEIPLEDDIVLHIFPCTYRNECTNFAYELREESEPEASEEYEESEELGEPAVVERRTTLKPESTALIARVKSLPIVSPTTFPTDSLPASPTASKTDSPSVAPSTGRTRSAHVQALRRSLDSTANDCDTVSIPYPTWSNGWGYSTTNYETCVLTVRMAFPQPLSGSSWFLNMFQDVAQNEAALIVAEFNEAIESAEPSMTNYKMVLEHLDMVYWDQSKSPMDNCKPYRATHDDSDLTHCITPDSMNPSSTGFTYGSAYGPSSQYKGISWATWKSLPSGSASGRHTSVHEFGHNLGAPHVKNGPNGASLMIKGSEPGASNRNLEYSDHAEDINSPGTWINNVDTIRQWFAFMANLH